MDYRLEEGLRRWAVALLLWLILAAGIGLYVFIFYLLYDP